MDFLGCNLIHSSIFYLFSCLTYLKWQVYTHFHRLLFYFILSIHSKKLRHSEFIAKVTRYCSAKSIFCSLLKRHGMCVCLCKYSQEKVTLLKKITSTGQVRWWNSVAWLGIITQLHCHESVIIELVVLLVYSFYDSVTVTMMITPSYFFSSGILLLPM